MVATLILTSTEVVEEELDTNEQQGPQRSDSTNPSSQSFVKVFEYLGDLV